MSIGKSKFESRLPPRVAPRPFAVARSAFAGDRPRHFCGIPLQRPDKAARLTALVAVVSMWQMRGFSRRDQAIRT
jgi:hypothetical protein